ncbi:tRNA (uridine(34)/cytosine(34)/5-carboxymethylaminomethyluridine(34)-2'-O)-methyltransferase TrmL [Chromatiales bacterium (ex Bugula neritina AB1)]|nr:tRNA (uridine(34)/cytosine(34)/5-carboxymethylaminomethyluridine(34)-2'-O)-methyltransferase TrmL [Chromatiales bacterium (ex Bugula neritina AB1)]
MFNIVLFEPEIPPNTGNIMRLCANTGCSLHLIEPIGFELDEKRVKRAGLDYRDLSVTKRWSSLDDYLSEQLPASIYAFTTKGSCIYTDTSFKPGDTLLFGPETRGLPASILDSLLPAQKLRLPMMQGSRSLNLSNTVAIAVYEGWRQNQFTV